MEIILAEVPKAFTQVLNTVVARLSSQGPRHQHWVELDPQRLVAYADVLRQRLLAIEQGVVQVLAQRYLDRQATPQALRDHLAWLGKRRLAQMPGVSGGALDSKVKRYERQLLILTHFQQAWRQALETSLKNGQVLEQARQRLQEQVASLDSKVKAGKAGALVTLGYLEAVARREALRDILRRFDVLFAPSASAASREAPSSFGQLPPGLGLLALEERPGYVRVTLTSASAGSGQRLEVHERGERLVFAGAGDFYLAFGDSVDAVFRQQLQLRYVGASSSMPLPTPLRSLLLESDFVTGFLGSHLANAGALGNVLELVLRGGQGRARLEAVCETRRDGLLRLTVSGALGGLLGRHMVRDSLHIMTPDQVVSQRREGKFVDSLAWGLELGWANSLYVLPLMRQGKGLPTTPLESQSSNSLSSARQPITDDQLKQLYEQHMAFFVQLAQLSGGTRQAPAWLSDPGQRTAFEAHFGELLVLNHLVPSAMEGVTKADGRDVRGNSTTWMAWERQASLAIWHHPGADRLVSALADKLTTKMISALLGDAQEMAQLRLGRRLLAPLYGQWLLQEGWEAIKRREIEGSVGIGRREDVDQATTAADRKLLFLLHKGGVEPKSADAPYKEFVDTMLASANGRALRKRVVFGALGLMVGARRLDSQTLHAHRLLEGHDRLTMSSDNFLLQRDPYLSLNAGMDQAMVNDQGVYRIAAPHDPATRYMRTLGLPYVGGVSGLAEQVTLALPGLLKRILTLPEYWQFQLNQAAFNLLRGDHALFEVLYVAARYEPLHTGGIGKRLLALLDKQYTVKNRETRLSALYSQAMGLILPIVNQGGALPVQLNLAALPDARREASVAPATDPEKIRGAGELQNDDVARRYELSEKLFNALQDPRFLAGRRDSEEITILGWREDMTLLELKRLFLEGVEIRQGELEARLTREEQGALAQRIGEKSQQELIVKALAQSAKMAEEIRLLGSVSDRLAPQDFYLVLVGDGSGGRCYPLVRAMAVALQQQYFKGGSLLVDRLFMASANPASAETRLLKEGLRTLHMSIGASSASISMGQVKLGDVATRLGQLGESGMFALNTPVHAMLVGMTLGPQGRQYYFYDPNFALFAFKDVAALAKAMNQHLVQRQMATFYQVLGGRTDPVFELVKINTERMAAVSLGHDLMVGDLVASSDLAQIREARLQDLEIGIAMEVLEARNWVARFQQATADLAQRSGLDSRYVLSTRTVEETSKGLFSLIYVNRQRLTDMRTVTSSDRTFIEFRRFVDKQTQGLYERVLEKARGAGIHASTAGLNAIYALQTLIQGLGDDYAKAQGAWSELSVALNIHSYLGLLQVVNNTVQDITYITELVRAAKEADQLKTGGKLMSYVARLGRATSDGGGLLLGALLVGLDGYELIHARNERQRALFATHLAFDSASMITGVAGIGAELLGASVTGAVLGAGSVLMSGLAVGFGGLAEVFGQTYDDAQAVGHYFKMIDAAYRSGGYQYDLQQKALIAQAGAVIIQVDLRIGLVKFDSQYIYRSDSVKNGAIGSGAANYFFWAGHIPSPLIDRKQAIDIREGLGYPLQVRLPTEHAKVIVLPATPRTYLNYGFGVLPFVTLRHAEGFDLIRRLENDKRFDYDFYIFPFERVINRIDQQFVATTVQVLLDSKSHHLVVPRLSPQMQGYLHYDIKGFGGQYKVSLSRGVSLRLANEGKLASAWVLDISELDGGKIQVGKDSLNIDGVRVDVVPGSHGQIMTIDRLRVVREIDFARQQTLIRSLDATQWISPHGLDHSLEGLMRKQHAGSFVVIENYKRLDAAPERAFYDVANDRMILPDFAQRANSDVRLVGVQGDYAYFHDAGLGLAWRSSVAEGKYDPNFARWMRQRRGSIRRVWMEHDAVFIAGRIGDATNEQGELVYRVRGNSIELIAVLGDHDKLQTQLNAMATAGLASVFGSFGGHYWLDDDSSPKEAAHGVAPVLVVFGIKEGKEAFRAWVHTNTGVVVRPLLEPPPAKRGQVATWSSPNDLLLSASMTTPSGLSVYMFFSAKEKALFRQLGTGWNGKGKAEPTAMRVHTPPLSNVLSIDGGLYVVTSEGLMAKVDQLGNLSTVAVVERWFEGKALWWRSLNTLASSDNSPVAVFGIKGPAGKRLLPTWYHQQRLVITSPSLVRGSLQFVGVFGENEALLFEAEQGKVFVQPLMDEAALVRAFGAGRTLRVPGVVPDVRELLPGWRFKSAELDGGYLQLITNRGEIFLRGEGRLRLVGVDADWQQAHGKHLLPAITVLAAQHRASSIVALKGSTPGWFDVASGQLFRVKGRGPSNGMNFLGKEVQSSAAFIYDKQARQLLKVQGERSQVVTTLGNTSRVGRLLLIQGDDRGVRGEVMEIPLVAQISNVVLQGGKGSDTYIIGEKAWNQYDLIIIDNYDKAGTVDRLQLPGLRITDLSAKRVEDDMWLGLADMSKSLVLRRIFGDQAQAYRHMHITFAQGMAIDVEQLVGASKQAQRVEQLVALKPGKAQLGLLREAMAALDNSGDVEVANRSALAFNDGLLVNPGR